MGIQPSRDQTQGPGRANPVPDARTAAGPATRGPGKGGEPAQGPEKHREIHGPRSTCPDRLRLPDAGSNVGDGHPSTERGILPGPGPRSPGPYRSKIPKDRRGSTFARLRRELLADARARSGGGSGATAMRLSAATNSRPGLQAREPTRGPGAAPGLTRPAALVAARLLSLRIPHNISRTLI